MVEKEREKVALYELSRAGFLVKKLVVIGDATKLTLRLSELEIEQEVCPALSTERIEKLSVSPAV